MEKLPQLSGQVSEILRIIDAPPRLIAHLTLVHAVAAKLVREIRSNFPELHFDQSAVLFGAATHDVGKAVVPSELEAPGSKHEERGFELLAGLGIPESLSRFTRTHARWFTDDVTIEDLLVSLADKIWKGTRQEDLERILMIRISQITSKPEWEIYSCLDASITGIAQQADRRLEWQSQFAVSK